MSLFRQTRLSVGGQSTREQSHAGSSHKPFHIVLLLGVALLTIAYDSGRSADQRFEASPQADRDPGPIPLDGPLARPKSLEQSGVPIEATRAAAPAQRNAPTILNALYNAMQFWDGRAKTLEEQAALPIIKSY